MVSFMMKWRRVALSGMPRVVGRLHGSKLYVSFFASVAALAITCVLAARADAPSAQPTPEYFRQKADQNFALCVEVYYLTWHAFTYASVRERELVTDSWTCRSTLRFPTATPLAEELAAMQLEPLKKRPRDFRLSGIVTFNEKEKPVTVSFAKYPLSVCINGQPFKPSWNLLLRISEFLPDQARRELLKGVREDWRVQGYPGVPEEEEGEGEKGKNGAAP